MENSRAGNIPDMRNFSTVLIKDALSAPYIIPKRKPNSTHLSMSVESNRNSSVLRSQLKEGGAKKDSSVCI